MAGHRSRVMVVNVSWVFVILVLAEMGCAQEPAQSPSSGGCDDTVSELTPCLSYIMANDSTPPSKDCCSGLVKVVKGNIVCLCTLLASSSSYGITVNQTRAAAMPAACKVQTPPISACAALAPAPTTTSSDQTALAPAPTTTSPDSNGLGSPTAGLNGGTPVLGPSATTGAADSFTPSPFSIFTGLLLAGVAQLLI